MSVCAADINRLIYRFYIFLYLIDIFPKLYKHTIEKKLNFEQGLRGEHSSWQIDWSSQFPRTTNYHLRVNSCYIKVIKVEKLCTLCLKVDMKLIDTYIILFNIKSCSFIVQILLFTLLKFEDIRTSSMPCSMEVCKSFFFFLLFQWIACQKKI